MPQPPHISITDQSGPPESRRDFLKQSLAAALAVAAQSPRRGLAIDGAPAAPPLPTTSPAALARSRVVRITDQRLIPVRIVQPALLKDYLAEGLMQFTGRADPADAWHDILDPDDIVLIKFNRSGADRIGTAPALASALLDSLLRAGWSPDRLMFLEVGPSLRSRRDLRAPDLRWQQQIVRFGRSGSDSFIAALDQATAVINVPFLKTHHRATMTACLKNLSHGLIRHPARFHTNGCDPAIGEITASPPVKKKLKFNIVNALRTVFDRGPEAAEKDMATAGILLLGADPVACDAVGFGILNELRAVRELPPLLPGGRVPPQLTTAARLGVGRFDPERIDLMKLPA